MPSSGGWTEIPHGHPANQASYLLDDWSHASDVWAAGYRHVTAIGVDEYRTWVQRCNTDVGTCSLENTLDVEARPADTRAFGVTGTAADDVWIAGSAKQLSGRTAPLIEHFDGSTWSIVATPYDVGELGGISAVSADDVWAVGRQSVVGLPNKAIVLHWDGSSWMSEPVRVGGCEGGLALSSVDASGPWPIAIGTCWDGVHSGAAVILSRGQHGWRRDLVDVPRPRSFSLNSISWTGRTAWASAQYLNPMKYNGLILRRQHHVWSRVEAPSRAGITMGLAGPNGHDVWAVGTHRLTWATMHWDGTAWRRVVDPGGGVLHAVTVTAQGSPWAIGEKDTPVVSEIQRYDGGVPRSGPGASPSISKPREL